MAVEVADRSDAGKLRKLSREKAEPSVRAVASRPSLRPLTTTTLPRAIRHARRKSLSTASHHLDPSSTRPQPPFAFPRPALCSPSGPRGPVAHGSCSSPRTRWRRLTGPAGTRPSRCVGWSPLARARRVGRPAYHVLTPRRLLPLRLLPPSPVAPGRDLAPAHLGRRALLAPGLRRRFTAPRDQPRQAEAAHHGPGQERPPPLDLDPGAAPPGRPLAVRPGDPHQRRQPREERVRLAAGPRARARPQPRRRGACRGRRARPRRADKGQAQGQGPDVRV